MQWLERGRPSRPLLIILARTLMATVILAASSIASYSYSACLTAKESQNSKAKGMVSES